MTLDMRLHEYKSLHHDFCTRCGVARQDAVNGAAPRCHSGDVVWFRRNWNPVERFNRLLSGI